MILFFKNFKIFCSLQKKFPTCNCNSFAFYVSRKVKSIMQHYICSEHQMHEVQSGVVAYFYLEGTIISKVISQEMV